MTEKGQRMSTTQDYQAAEQLLRRPARPGELVIGDRVRPQWIDEGARFWYAVSNGVGRRFVLVDPAAGTREPAFDHARFAAALAAASGQQVDPSTSWWTTTNPYHYLFYEVYRDQDAFAAHRASEHFARWRQAAEVCLSGPLEATHTAMVLTRSDRGEGGRSADSRA